MSAAESFGPEHGLSEEWSEPTLYEAQAPANDTFKYASVHEQINGRFLFQTEEGVRTFAKAGVYTDENGAEQTLFQACDSEGNEITRSTPTAELDQFTEIISLEALQRYLEQGKDEAHPVIESAEDYSTPKYYSRAALKKAQHEEEAAWGNVTLYRNGHPMSPRQIRKLRPDA